MAACTAVRPKGGTITNALGAVGFNTRTAHGNCDARKTRGNYPVHNPKRLSAFHVTPADAHATLIVLS